MHQSAKQCDAIQKSAKKCDAVEKSAKSAKRHWQLLILPMITKSLLDRQSILCFIGFAYFWPYLLVPTLGVDCLDLLLEPPFSC